MEKSSKIKVWQKPQLKTILKISETLGVTNNAGGDLKNKKFSAQS